VCSSDLDFRLLVRRQLQRFGHVLERIAVTMPSAAVGGAVFRLGNGEAAERDCSGRGNCK